MDTTNCQQCGDVYDTDDLTPDHNGDQICPDCHATNLDVQRNYAY